MRDEKRRYTLLATKNFFHVGSVITLLSLKGKILTDFEERKKKKTIFHSRGVAIVFDGGQGPHQLYFPLNFLE